MIFGKKALAVGGALLLAKAILLAVLVFVGHTPATVPLLLGIGAEAAIGVGILHETYDAFRRLGV